MARTLNFDAVVVETIEVIKNGRTFALRDDIPMPVLVRTFTLMELQSAMKDRNGMTAEDAEEWLAELEAKTLALCGDIFRHTDPEMTDGEIARLFSWEEQSQLIMLFFTTRYSQLEALAKKPAESLAKAGRTARSSVSSATVKPQRPGAVGGTTRRKR